MSSSLLSSLERLRTGLAHPPVEIVWSSHSAWPLPPPNQPSNNTEKIQISILDASYNPPTLGHFALAAAPAPRSLRAPAKVSDHVEDSGSYDAKLLLLSVRNADKKLKPSDATYVQRVEMMIEIGSGNPSSHGIAVAIIDEPTFVGKSRVLREFLEERIRRQQALRDLPDTRAFQLTFILGYDTLERLFATKYYDSSEEKMYQALHGFFAPTSDNSGGDDSRVVWGRRSASSYPHAASTSTSTSVEVSSSDSSDVREGVKTYRGSDLDVNKGSQLVGSVGLGEHKWKEMISERVGKYIIEHGLYK
ncbi:hypothetical protein BT96DRAFT_820884 [Gymnopus androsaceus JB14]|uniref:Nucleotidylyl transferase n=1 Tax=Gymnopus androsaceus JB14 TaxID=1447944 RepID=A0A6A4HNB4_9AGAR|nr:hypothetical protein BT96DRAFT_820884 [Gymnopus androsaceus JB14]